MAGRPHYEDIKYNGGGLLRSDASNCAASYLTHISTAIDSLLLFNWLDIKMKIVYAMLGVMTVGSAGNLKND